jgi:homoserine kinase
MGSGFDTLGLALQLHNTLRVSRVPRIGLSLGSCPAGADPAKAKKLLTDAADLFFERQSMKPFGLKVDFAGEVPVGRGLGASAIARVGMLCALNRLSGACLSKLDLLEMALEAEGHPDNATPALFGGFTVAGNLQGTVRHFRFPVSSDLRFVTLIPSFEIDTEKARRLLPASVSMRVAAHSLNRAALISAAFAAGDYGALRGLFDDQLHQPHREQLIPELSAIIRAGEAAGAIGGWLSGSGSAIMCLTQRRPDVVARAMHHQMTNSTVLILKPDAKGAIVRSS